MFSGRSAFGLFCVYKTEPLFAIQGALRRGHGGRAGELRLRAGREDMQVDGSYGKHELRAARR